MNMPRVQKSTSAVAIVAGSVMIGALEHHERYLTVYDNLKLATIDIKMKITR
jgi:hypothetical protein